MYIAHVLLLPVAIGTLLALHLPLVASRHHTQFRSRRATERAARRRLPAFPAQAPRSLGLMFAVAAVLVLLGGLAQINPIWLWGPYHVAAGTNGAQPDWYLGWLIGTLRLVPGFDVVIGGRTVVPNPFWGGALFPGLVFGSPLPLAVARAALLGRPRLARTCSTGRATTRGGRAFGVALVTWLFLVFLAGSADRVYVLFGISYTAQIWVYRVSSSSPRSSRSSSRRRVVRGTRSRTNASGRRGARPKPRRARRYQTLPELPSVRPPCARAAPRRGRRAP